MIAVWQSNTDSVTLVPFPRVQLHESSWALKSPTEALISNLLLMEIQVVGIRREGAFLLTMLKSAELSPCRGDLNGE